MRCVMTACARYAKAASYADKNRLFDFFPRIGESLDSVVPGI